MKEEVRNNFKERLEANRLDDAEQILADALVESPEDDTLYLMQGNLHRKRGELSLALASYAKAVELNPVSPARQARELILRILAFYDKDRYNV